MLNLAGLMELVCLEQGQVYPEKKLYEYVDSTFNFYFFFKFSWLYVLPVPNSQPGCLESRVRAAYPQDSRVH